MESTRLPKVSRIVSSRPISDDTAFQMIAKFLEKEQRRLDPAVLHQSGHWGDVFLVCEALAKSEAECAQLEGLRQAAPVAVKEEEYDDAASQPTAVLSAVGIETAAASSPTRKSPIKQQSPKAKPSPNAKPSPVKSMSSQPPVKQEDIQADEQPSSHAAVKNEQQEDEITESKSKRRAEKKSKKEKKRKKHRHE